MMSPAEAARALLDEIREESEGRELSFMEVCGGHTISFFKFGLRDMLPSNVKMISGPGCPVCVSAQSFLDRVVALSRLPDSIIATFGDLVRVPGSTSSLLKEKAKGADVRVVYSPTDALEIARKNPEKKIILPGIGFETTAPLTAAVVKRAKEEGLTNFYALSAHKTMPEAMEIMAKGNIDGFLCPGHVTSIAGISIYEPLARDYGKPCVISGFEALDILRSILMMVRQIKNGVAIVENEYERAVPSDGNPIARKIMEEVFEPIDDEWRGLGKIPGSGLGIRKEYAAHDAMSIPVEVEKPRPNPGCICGSIMAGKKTPHDCKLFGKECTPEDPAGSCMVSDEGTCATYYKFARNRVA